MKPRRWFLPETPDVVGLLREQCAVATEALDAFAAWAAGDADAAATLTGAEERADGAKRAVLDALRTAFVTPLEPEDAFALSRSIDRVIVSARDCVVEATVLDSGPDAGIAEMAVILARALRSLEQAIAKLAGDGDTASARAEAALAEEKALDAAYARGMAALLEEEDRTARIARRELYRRCARMGDIVVEAGERIIYAVVKQS